MIRLIIGPRLGKSLAKLPQQATAEAERRLSGVMEQFGNPHAHAGLGLRKIGPHSYECRIWLQWRIVLIDRGDCLFAFDVMNHDEVRRWLRGH